MDIAELVQNVKNIQRSSIQAKDAWGLYCITYGQSGSRDPAKYDAAFLTNFITQIQMHIPEAGVAQGTGGALGTPVASSTMPTSSYGATFFPTDEPPSEFHESLIQQVKKIQTSSLEGITFTFHYVRLLFGNVASFWLGSYYASLHPTPLLRSLGSLT